MDIENRIKAIRQAVEAACRESGGAPHYIACHRNSVSVHVEVDGAVDYAYSHDNPPEARPWYSFDAKAFAATFSEAVALPPAATDGGEE